MSSIHIRPIRLQKWFPPNDTFATSVAQLCILREDFYLEIHGIIEDPIEFLDRNTAAWRHNYFFRNSIRTLMEIRGALEILWKVDEFKEALAEEPTEVADSLAKLLTGLRKSHDLIKFVRNKICGHVQHRDVHRALAIMDFDRRGIVEIGENFKSTHFKFTSELFIAILQAGNPAKKIADRDIEEVLDMTATMARLVPALTAIDSILSIYKRARRLS